MTEKVLVIEITYLQGNQDWERRVEKVVMNGEEVPYHKAVSELLKTQQPKL